MSHFVPVAGFNHSLEGTTVVLPSVSIGNIPQLAIDLLIHTLGFQKIGTLDDRYLYPFASPVDLVDKALVGVSNAIEVYYSETHNLVAIQQRSPIIPSFVETYVSEIVLPFILGHKFAKVYVLDSSDAGLVENVVQGRIDSYTSADFLNQSLESLNLNNQEPLAAPYSHLSYVRSLVSIPRKEEGFSSLDINVLVTHVYEGDNFGDGEALANELINVLGLAKVAKWNRPISWLGVYGDKPVPIAMEQGLFG
ncbi:uncharacterized protein CANTADRAFT_49206 [Suhomyces tanzawaensis NRRL Y-17324]|uniref:Proteasome assembly chaperone 2 n=1 Tax=Suhomyces tanzawaensis NRRL Y-17324 TaxID=984487 RepID=A0A1E4SL52_9ASCO|nr:uncharacterized protein CANTADRAFT_49206 [Suhomyces tanzawaensis NRRL Y-17324]ODV80167.1 hypothetical protein CANTADRAFT_49206 [Suhomyces tanzawaensis NRRL Y-17324]